MTLSVVTVVGLVGGAPGGTPRAPICRVSIGKQPPRKYLYLGRHPPAPAQNWVIEQPNPTACSCRLVRAVCWLGLSENTARLSRDGCRESSQQQKAAGPSRARTRSESPEQPALLRRSRRDSHDAPGPAPLRRGRPPRRPEEVDPRDHTSDGAGAGGAKAADGGAEGPEGAREA